MEGGVKEKKEMRGEERRRDEASKGREEEGKGGEWEWKEEVGEKKDRASLGFLSVLED